MQIATDDLTAPPLDISERSFQAQVLRVALAYGWQFMHVPAVFTRGSWRTPTQGTPGFPDLVLARDGVLLLVELKTEKGRFRPGQEEWVSAAGEHGYIWRPSNWAAILQTLAGDSDE
jgi:hypothetical protein